MRPVHKAWDGLSRALLILLLLVAAGCARRPPEPPPARSWPTDSAACFAQLRNERVSFTPWAGAPNDGACTVPAPVAVEASSAAMTPLLRTSCPMMLAWARFEPTMQRLARDRLGTTITAIHHYGSYNCRRMSGNAGRMSLHSTGQALDISAFGTADGRRIVVVHDWHRQGPEGRFLHELGQAACRHFNVVLTPNHDRAHHDHIHVDIGPWRYCGA